MALESFCSKLTSYQGHWVKTQTLLQLRASWHPNVRKNRYGVHAFTVALPVAAARGLGKGSLSPRPHAAARERERLNVMGSVSEEESQQNGTGGENPSPSIAATMALATNLGVRPALNAVSFLLLPRGPISIVPLPAPPFLGMGPNYELSNSFLANHPAYCGMQLHMLRLAKPECGSVRATCLVRVLLCMCDESSEEGKTALVQTTCFTPELRIAIPRYGQVLYLPWRPPSRLLALLSRIAHAQLSLLGVSSHMCWGSSASCKATFGLVSSLANRWW